MMHHFLRRSTLLILIALVTSSSLKAQNSQYAGAFLNIPVGVRALGMGGIYVPTDNTDGAAFQFNPAGVSLVKDKTLTTMYSNQFGTLGAPLGDFFHIGYTQSLGNNTSFSLNWIRLGIQNISLNRGPSNATTDADIQELLQYLDNPDAHYNIGTFSSTDDAFYLSIAKNFTFPLNFGWQYFSIPVEIPLGINFKLIREGFSGSQPLLEGGQNSYSGTGIGVDVGGMFKFKLSDFLNKPYYGEFAMSLTIKDIFNTPISWNTDTQTKENIKASTLFGLSYSQPLMFASSTILVSWNHFSKDNGGSNYGAEYRYKDLLALRAGVLEKNLTLGAGLVLFKAFYIDYAYEFHELGGPHRIGITVNLSRFF
jgi:hypothetical protein